MTTQQYRITFTTQTGQLLSIVLNAPSAGEALRSADELYRIDLSKPGLLTGPGIERQWSPLVKEQP